MAFFDATERYEHANRDLYVVINASQASLELVAAEAARQHQAHPERTRPQLREALFPGFHARGIKIDVCESLLDRTVSENWRVLAGFALITLVARYETWLDDVVALAPAQARTVPPPPGRGSNASPVALGLQFPHPSPRSQRWRAGYAAALAALERTQDPRLRASITPTLHRAYGTDRRHLRRLLTVYRYFKEIRNSLAHGHGRASQQLARLSRTTQSFGAASLGVKAIPTMPVYAAGDDVPLTVRDVVLFDSVVTRIVKTLDAEMASHAAGSEAVRLRTREFTPGRESLPADPAKRERRLQRMLAWAAQAGAERAGGLGPTPIELRAFERFLQHERLVV